MNFRGLLNLLALCGLTIVLAGCASSPRSGQHADSEDALAKSAIPDPNKPNMFFPGGNIQQVRGAAMGAAVTQGWEVKKAGRDSLILQRDLDDVAAENLASGASRGPLPPVVEVRTDFFDRSGGVNVQLAAEVITARGTNKEKRQDSTTTYRNELMHALSILQNDWREAGPKIANALPPIGGSRDSMSSGYSAAESDTNSSQDSFLPNALPDDSDKSPEDNSQSPASNWSLPPTAAANATAAAVSRANSLPNKVTSVPTVTKTPPTTKGPPPATTPVTKTASAATPTLFTPAPKTSPTINPKVAPTTTTKVTPPAPGGGRPINTSLTMPLSAMSGVAKPNTTTTNMKSSSAVPTSSSKPKTSTATAKSVSVAVTKTPANVTSKSSSLPVTTAKASSGTKSSAVPAANSKTTGTPTPASKASSVPTKTVASAKSNTSKAKDK